MTKKLDEQKTKLPARVHPDERAKIETLNQAAQLFHGKPPERSPIRYYTPELIQCTLPHSDPKTHLWVRKNGNYTLIVQSGVDNNGDYFGIPYGSFPRLVIAHIVTSVIRSGERRIDFSAYFSNFLKDVGYEPNLNSKQSKNLRDSLERVLNANISHIYQDDDHRTRKNINIAPTSVLWWDFKNPQQGSMWNSYIEISEELREAILRNPVPLHTDMLAALKKSPLALDVYMWVSYRLYTMHKDKKPEITLSYGRLQEQFGSGIATKNYRNFRHELKLAFSKVLEAWKEVSKNEGKERGFAYEAHEAELTLYRSALLITPKLPATSQTHTQVLDLREFDAATLKKARQIAGNWDMKFLAEQYFAWIEREEIIPHDPAAHFFTFIKSHRQRNGESI